jgi:predicted extracellular nuclease
MTLLYFVLNEPLFSQRIDLNTNDKPLLEKATLGNLEFLGQATFATGFFFEGVPLGGLSGITYDAVNDIYYGISDDFGRIAPARFYTLKIELKDGTLDQGDVIITASTTLLDENGEPFAERSIDSEGIALTKSGTLYISSEGNVKARVDPFIREFNLDGSYLNSLVVPSKYLPIEGGKFGIRNNRAFESLTLTPDNAFLFTAIENALVQDGPSSDLNTRSPARILKYDLDQGKPVAEFLYWVDPVVTPPNPADAFRINGLVELTAIDEKTFISMERSFSVGNGNTIKLYETSLSQADDISGYESLQKVDLSEVNAAQKTLLLDLTDLGITLDNLEGMTFGPSLADGRRTLILVSDNNFNPGQFTQFLAFAMGTKAPGLSTPIHTIQGSSHTSPWLGKLVKNVSGIVTAIKDRGRARGFWMQDPLGDRDQATSEGIFVSTASESPEVVVGDSVLVSGMVKEVGFPGSLTTTQIINPTITVLSRSRVLPDATVIGFEGRIPPTKIIDDDSFRVFDPKNDGIDFYESLEGMLVQVNDAVVVGATSRHGEIAVLADAGVNATPRTARGGIIVQPDDFNPERILVDDLLVRNAPNVNVGDRFEGAMIGVIDYSFGNFKLLNTEPLPQVISGGLTPESTALVGAGEQLTVATFNVENLDFQDREKKFQGLAQIIVNNLAAPDILGLQEVQDNTGSADDGVVDATKTFERLIDTIKKTGGPEYEFRQINPLDKRDGGEPGGNIRVGFLFNPERVSFIDRGTAGPTDATEVVAGTEGVQLSLSPGRVAPNDPAFSGDKLADFQSSRKSIAGEFEFNGHKIFVINNHFKSKRGDDRLFGSKQPPLPLTEVQRSKQALVIHDFVQSILSEDLDANVIVLGDLNEFEFRPAVKLLAGVVLTNLIEQVPLEERYTYIFNGNSQVLDHILVSKNLLSKGSPGIDIVHVNAEFAEAYRASDHDPVLARFTIAGGGQSTIDN